MFFLCKEVYRAGGVCRKALQVQGLWCSNQDSRGQNPWAQGFTGEGRTAREEAQNRNTKKNGSKTSVFQSKNTPRSRSPGPG